MAGAKIDERLPIASEEERLAERMRWAASVLRQCVDVNPNVRAGIPVLKGTRFTIAQLFAELAQGRSTAEIAADFDLDPNMLQELMHGFSTHLDRPLPQ